MLLFKFLTALPLQSSSTVYLLFSLFIFSFLRSVSYREFSRLVYGFLGNRRIPLPACAYSAIRKTLPCDKDEQFTGFDLDEEDD